MLKNQIIYLLPFLLLTHSLSAQAPVTEPDTSINERSGFDRLNLSLYMRVISDANGHKRADENIVANFKLLNWLRMEAGFRQGERPHEPDSYYHYKLELQTKFFWKSLRVLARVSDNILNAPAPSYRKTNKLFAIEGRYRLSRLFMLHGGVGYVFSSQQFNHPDLLPTFKGSSLNYPIFRLSLRYKSNKDGFFEVTYGSYDVFNPYYYNAPFAQLMTEQELSKKCTFFSYFRYQYNNNPSRPFNYFLCAGVRFNWR